MSEEFHQGCGKNGQDVPAKHYPTPTETPRLTDKHIERCIGDCENAAAAPDDLAVICGKMTLRTVVAEAKRARILTAQLAASEASRMQWRHAAEKATAQLEGVGQQDANHKRLVRELDVLLNGDKAAAQASLCDIVAQVRKYSERLQAVLAGTAPKPDFLTQLKEVSDRALDNMEGEDLEGFKRWQNVHLRAEDLMEAITSAEGSKNG